MGVLAPGSAHARPSAQTSIDVSGNFLAPMSAESPSNIFPNPSEFISEELGQWQYASLKFFCGRFQTKWQNAKVGKEMGIYY